MLVIEGITKMNNGGYFGYIFRSCLDGKNDEL